MPIGTLSPATFEWKITRFHESLGYACFIYNTSNFQRTVDSPTFHLPDSSWYLRLTDFSTERLAISLVRRDSGVPKTVTYTIKINVASGVQKISKTSYFHTRNNLCGEDLMFYKDEVEYSSDLLVTCCIKSDTPHPVAAKDIVSCAVQTEVANSVIEKENPKNEEWSSLDMKGVELLSECMKELLLKGGDHDVTICVQNKKFRAHRSILSARSPVFAMMLKHDTKENNTGTISIEDCDPESFDEFLLYVYSGRTGNLTPSNALQIYYAADKYDFPVLKERCVSLLKTSLSVESICDVVLLAAKHQEKELLEMATEFFARNVKKILVTVSWQKFIAQKPVEANELYIKSMEILHPEN